MEKTVRSISALYTLSWYFEELKIRAYPHKLLMRMLSLSEVTAKRLIASLFRNGYIDFKPLEECRGKDLEDVKRRARDRIEQLYKNYGGGIYIGFQLAKIMDEILKDEECPITWYITDVGKKVLKEKLKKKGLDYDELIKKDLSTALKDIVDAFRRERRNRIGRILTRPPLISIFNNQKELEDYKSRLHPNAPIQVEIVPAKFVDLISLHSGIQTIDDLVNERGIKLHIGAGLEFIADREKVGSDLKNIDVYIKHKQKKSKVSLYGFFGQHLFSPLISSFRAYTTLYPVFVQGQASLEDVRSAVSRWYWPKIVNPEKVLDSYDGVYIKKVEIRRGNKKEPVYDPLVPGEIRKSLTSVIKHFNETIYHEVYRALTAMGLAASIRGRRPVDVINASKAFATPFVTLLWRDLHYMPFPALSGRAEDDLKELTGSYKELWTSKVLDAMHRSNALIMLDRDFYGSIAWLLEVLKSAEIVRVVSVGDESYILPYSLYQRLVALRRYVGGEKDEDIVRPISAIVRIVKSRSGSSMPTEDEVLKILAHVFGGKEKAERILETLYHSGILQKIESMGHKYVLTPFDVPGLLLELSTTPMLSLLNNDSYLPVVLSLIHRMSDENKSRLLDALTRFLDEGKLDLRDYADIALTPEFTTILMQLRNLGVVHKGTMLNIESDGRDRELRTILSILKEALEWSHEDVDKEEIEYAKDVMNLDKRAVDALRSTKAVQDQLEGWR